jgi:arsenate reductase
MPMITVYQKPTCTSCRKVHGALIKAGVDFKEVNHYTESISRPKLKELLSKLKMAPPELLRKEEPIYTKLGSNRKDIDEDEILDLMVKNPDLIQRPIVESGKTAVLARPAARVFEILSETRKCV